MQLFHHFFTRSGITAAFWGFSSLSCGLVEQRVGGSCSDVKSCTLALSVFLNRLYSQAVISSHSSGLSENDSPSILITGQDGSWYQGLHRRHTHMATNKQVAYSLSLNFLMQGYFISRLFVFGLDVISSPIQIFFFLSAQQVHGCQPQLALCEFL